MVGSWQTLDVEQTSVGGEADLPQRGQVAQSTADAEVAAVIDGRLGTEGLTLFVVLLDLRVLVVHVQARGDPFGEHPGAEPSRGGPLAPGADLRSKMSPTLSGRPRSRLSRITSSKNTRPVTGRSSTWVRENSACRIEMS